MEGEEFFEPGYITLYHSGELARRAEALEARLSACDICPHRCGINRLEGEKGFCHSGQKAIVSSVCAHHGEEPVLSGNRGSGTVFFGNCTLRCVYCQNYQISQNWRQQLTKDMDCHTLAERLLYLQDELGCHNINFVSPSHFVPQIVRTLVEAVPMGLRLPLVYNTSGYDTVETLRELDGIISIYLPDLRYASDEFARKFSGAAGYVSHARAAIQEMYRQVGDVALDEAGVAQKGLIVRHLVLPERLAGSQESLSWLAEQVSPTVTVSIMSQYFPAHRARQFPSLARTILLSEYAEVIELVNRLGLENGWLQEMESPEHYLPDFTRESQPFNAVADDVE